MKNKMKILIVDDTAINRKLLHATLEAEGHSVLQAADGLEALAVLEREPVDAVISDILMPRMDGFQLCHELRQREKLKHVGFIHYTSVCSSSDDMQLSNSMGADNYLIKPASTEVLLRTLEDARRHALVSAPAAPGDRTTQLMQEYSVALITKLGERNAELHHSEERLRLATEATGVGIWEWNLITGVVHWDAQMFRIYGIAPTPDGFVTYSDWRNTVLPEDLPGIEEGLQDMVRRLGNINYEFRMRRGDGECRYIQTVGTVRANARGQAEWAVGTNLDVTERKQMEAALKDADRRKDEFLATLAHELRNPLAAVRNSLELMTRGSGNAAVMEQARSTMERQTAQMVHLIDDLLDVSRITRNRLELRLVRVELASVLQHVLEAGRPQCEQAGHQLHISLPPDRKSTRLNSSHG